MGDGAAVQCTPLQHSIVLQAVSAMAEQDGDAIMADVATSEPEISQDDGNLNDDKIDPITALQDSIGRFGTSALCLPNKR